MPLGAGRCFPGTHGIPKCVPVFELGIEAGFSATAGVHGEGEARAPGSSLVDGGHAASGAAQQANVGGV